LGWVFATVVEYKGEKLIHSSDLNGPIIEDYASWIIKENPDYLILDGPATYLIPYVLNLINFKRCVENICKIIKETNVKILILDHHLPREARYKQRLKKVYEAARAKNKKVVTAAELLGKKPKILELKDCS
jgi:predicted metallo-beta-lactamase superfamily hydrolase